MLKPFMNPSTQIRITLMSLLLVQGSVFAFSDGLSRARQMAHNILTDIPVIRISFGEGIPKDWNLQNMEWKIVDAEGLILVSGSGNSIYDHVFERPGEFKIALSDGHDAEQHDQHGCSHQHYPEEILVIVSSMRMKYKLDELKFSKDIVANASAADIGILVPLVVESYDKNAFTIDLLDAQSHGIGTSLVAVPEERSFVVGSGTYLLKYKLVGRATQREAILMFDFMDNNGNVQCYTHMVPVK